MPELLYLLFTRTTPSPDSILWWSFLPDFLYQRRISCICGRQIDFLSYILFRIGHIPPKSKEVQSCLFASNGLILISTQKELNRDFISEESTGRTKNNDRLLTLVKAATRRGYSVTSTWLSRRLISSCGAVVSAWSKSTMLGWFAYIRSRRGVNSPRPWVQDS